MAPKSGVKRGPYKKTVAKRTALARRLKKSIIRKKYTPYTIYKYSRWANAGQTMECTGTTYSVTNTFTLDDVKGYTDFTSLYDQFRITYVQIFITLINNPNAFLNTNGAINAQNQNNWYPKFWYVYDGDDNTSITLDNIRERQGVKYRTLLPNKTIKIGCKPTLLVQTYRTATATGYAPRRMFIDVATGQNVPHYGIKGVIDCMGIDPADKFMVRFETKYFLSFKGVL